MSNIMIDTQIWVYSKKIPKKDKFESEVLFDKAMKAHLKALDFFNGLSEDTNIYFSYQQVGELFHSLAFRGSKVPLKATKEFILDLIKSDNIKIIQYSNRDLEKAISLSSRSNIHIWDYLCVIPLIAYISKIFTTDEHFKDKTFSDFGVSIENPLYDWQQI